MRSIDARRDLAQPHARPEWFSGPVWIQTLNDAGEAAQIEIFAVFFEAGARTLPHTHATDQLLQFVSGEGVVGTERERLLYRPGGTALIPANEWHWHGATPTSPMCHLSIRPGGPSSWAPDIPMLDWETYMVGVREAHHDQRR
ncbi:MAG TPA: cupin domain-containing protein [Actinomycetota bacterium]|jgi:quercetin dioxygenase-like cupin family protein